MGLVNRGIPNVFTDRCKVHNARPTHAQTLSSMNIINVHVHHVLPFGAWGWGRRGAWNAIDKGMQAANNMASKLPISTLN